MTIPLAHSANDWNAGHLLRDHSEAVAKLTEQFATLFGSSEYAYCAGLWHDLGKNAPGFQECLKSAADAHIEGLRTGYGDHASAGAIHALAKFGTAGNALALVIAGHHGGLADWAELRDGRLKDSDLLARLRACTSNPDAFIPEPNRPSPPGFLRPVARSQEGDLRRRCEFWIRMLFSCLVDADFLDTEAHFEPGKTTNRGGYLSLGELKQKFAGYMSNFDGSTGTVNETRRRVLDDCRRAGKSCAPGVFTLTAPTGCGKTLAGMGFALEHALAHGLSRVIVVLPFTSIIDQNADQYARVFGEETVIQHHASLDPVKETPRNRIACENWDAPVIVTTSVQFVESLFANRTSRCRKLHNVAGSVVIFDEVQTLPIGHLSPILDVLKDLVANYQASLVLSTATQPALKHRPTLACGFERVTEIISNVKKTFESLRRVSVHWPADLQTPRAWPDLAAELQRYDEVLCVVHRRPDAREFAELVPGSIHLSALMCPAHRLSVIGEVKRRLEENRNRRVQGEPINPVRLISTQLIEAGVDLDFPVVYRAAGGLDSIAQAAGRCNREGKLNGLGEVRVFVAPTQPPPGAPRFGLSVTREMLAGEADLDALDPARFDRFFQKLYFLSASLDEQKIQGLREGWNFKSVAEAFAMIEDDGAEAVVVPFGDAMRRLDDLRARGPSRDRLRALQPFVVKVYAKEFKAMEEAGAVENIFDIVKAIRVPGYERLYSTRFGLQTEGPFAADPTSLMV